MFTTVLSIFCAFSWTQLKQHWTRNIFCHALTVCVCVCVCACVCVCVCVCVWKIKRDVQRGYICTEVLSCVCVCVCVCACVCVDAYVCACVCVCLYFSEDVFVSAFLYKHKCMCVGVGTRATATDLWPYHRSGNMWWAGSAGVNCKQCISLCMAHMSDSWVPVIMYGHLLCSSRV